MQEQKSEECRTVLYLVRHGETAYNRRRIIQGRGIDSVLNETGRAQAALLGRRLAGVPFDAIYTSTLRRAEETAALLARHHARVPLYRLPELEEMAWGVYEGRAPTPEVLAVLDEVKERWRAGALDCTVDGGESVREVRARALKAIEHIAGQHAGGTVLVVTHGRLLRVLIASLLEDYGLERMHEVEHANTGLNKLIFRDGGCEASLLNCTLHLEGDAVAAE